jgi:DNA-binding CsgD family transcriptional regulator
LIDRNLRTLQGTSVSTGIDQAGEREYFEVWGHRNVFVERTRQWVPGAVVTDQQILLKPELLKSDYYNGFLKPRDMHALLRISIQIETDVHQSISLMRPRLLGEFEQADLDNCRFFLSHLQRSAGLSRRLSVSAQMLKNANQMLEENVVGVLLINCAGKVIFANRTARALANAADSFKLQNDQIVALNPDNDSQIRRLVAGATGRIDKADYARGGVIRLASKSTSKYYVAVIGSLPQTSMYADAPAAFILVSDPTSAPIPSSSLLQNIYGFTAAEVRLAGHLAAGKTPEQAALLMHTKITTVRSQLAHLFRKTGTSRQSDLTRMLVLLPASSGTD